MASPITTCTGFLLDHLQLKYRGYQVHRSHILLVPTQYTHPFKTIENRRTYVVRLWMEGGPPMLDDSSNCGYRYCYYERSTFTGLHPGLRLGSCHTHSTHDLERDIMFPPIFTSQLVVPSNLCRMRANCRVIRKQCDCCPKASGIFSLPEGFTSPKIIT